jgi:hypothetical protein
LREIHRDYSDVGGFGRAVVSDRNIVGCENRRNPRTQRAIGVHGYQQLPSFHA